MWDKSQYQKFYTIRERSVQGGGQAKIDRQHSMGKLTARERLDKRTKERII